MGVFNIKFVTGLRYNNLARCLPSAITVTNEHTLADFKRPALYDGRPYQEFRFATNAAGLTVTADLNLLHDGTVNIGNMNTWAGGLPTGWTVVLGSGAVAEATGGEARSGSAIKLTQGAAAYKELLLRSGELVFLEGYMRGLDSGTARAVLQNMDTGNFYNPGTGLWQAGSVVFGSTAATSYTLFSSGFQVETFAATLKDLTTVRLTLDEQTGVAGQRALFDDWYFWPHTHWLSLHGHNLTKKVAVEWRHSTDAFSGSNDLVQSIAVQPLVIYHAPAFASFRRYQRILIAGTNPETPYLGEAVLTQYQTALWRNFLYPGKLGFDLAQVRLRNDAGVIQVINQELNERRRLAGTFRGENLAQYQQFRDELYRRSAGGRERVLFVARDDDTEMCVLGTVPGLEDFEEEVVKDFDFELLEDAFPTPM